MIVNVCGPMQSRCGRTQAQTHYWSVLAQCRPGVAERRPRPTIGRCWTNVGPMWQNAGSDPLLVGAGPMQARCWPCGRPVGTPAFCERERNDVPHFYRIFDSSIHGRCQRIVSASPVSVSALLVCQPCECVSSVSV